ncbi:solute carrier family 15 member 5 [Hypanus sabinus]|uniref:solute carrier family 15 member 5 n=1 Tax=Hypanus sabinus TaxID=79690 RepID=UPI0028C4A324|nr:solute carrier family 15 member 5 [Hypanus sabinus]
MGLENPQGAQQRRGGNESGGMRHSRKKVQIVVCLLSVELCERFTHFGIVCNMILFCTLKLGYKNYQAAMANLCFIGANTLTPVLMGWLVESCMGRTTVVYTCALLHFIGTVMLPLVAFPFEDFYIDAHHKIHTDSEQVVLFYVALTAASLGSGGIRAIVCPFRAYHLQDCSQHQLLTFFNWFHWFVSLNSVVVFASIAYLQQSIAKNLGYLIPFISTLMTLITVHMVQNRLIFRPKSDGSLMATVGVLVNALKMCCMKYRHISGDVNNWLDRAKENYGGWYSEAHVNNVKCLIRLIPLFAFQVLYRFCILQIPSAYFIQTMHSNLNQRGFLLPVAALNIVGLIPVLLLAPLLEYIGSCLMSVHRDPMSPLTQMVIGHLCATLSMVVAGISEVCRKNFLLVEQVLSGKVLLVSSMPCLQLTPQYLLLGVAEALVMPAYTLITFRHSPRSIQGIAIHFMTLFNCMGCFVGAIIIQSIYQISGGTWFPNDLSAGNLDKYFFTVAAIMLLNLLGFWRISHRYRDLHQEEDWCVKGSLVDKLIEHEKSLKFYDSVLESSSIFYPVEMVL